MTAPACTGYNVIHADVIPRTGGLLQWFLVSPAVVRGVRTIAAAAAIASGALFVAACGSNTGPGDDVASQVDSLRALPRALSASERAGIASSNQFALSLFKREVAARDSNVLLSPLSVFTALGMTMNGAAGETEAEMQRTLGWGTRPRSESNVAYRDMLALLPTLDASVKVKIANGIWVRTPLSADPAFAGDVRQYFGAEVRSASSAQGLFDAVNAWGNQQTEGMIPKVLQGAPPDDLLMLLANAVYFDGAWRNAFDRKDTQSGPFRVGDAAGSATASVPMMHRKGGYRAYERQDFFAVELPYGNAAYHMLVLVPRTGTLNALVAGLDSSKLGEISAGLREVMSTSPLWLPRFTARGSLELSPALGALGMPRAFTDNAEFPRLLGPAVKLDFVRHGVAVEVNERGTRAAAVTAVGVIPVSAPSGHPVDRPFAFLIRERFEGTILVAGVIRDPRS